MSLLDKLLEELDRRKKTGQGGQTGAARQQQRKIHYQCRYCGYQSVRNATEGVPLPGVNNCPRHPKGVHKGPHSWMRTYL